MHDNYIFCDGTVGCRGWWSDFIIIIFFLPPLILMPDLHAYQGRCLHSSYCQRLAESRLPVQLVTVLCSLHIPSMSEHGKKTKFQVNPLWRSLHFHPVVNAQQICVFVFSFWNRPYAPLHCGSDCFKALCTGRLGLVMVKINNTFWFFSPSILSN